MKFGNPFWLLAALAAIPLLWWIFNRFQKARLEALKKFAAERLLPGLTAGVSARSRTMKQWLFIFAAALGLFALAQPQYGFRWQEVKRKGIDILFAVDTSKSMLAQDISPDRLTRAKLAVADFVEKLEGDRVGLIAFAGTAFLQCPLTLDYDAFRQSLEALDTSIIPKGGSNLGAAIVEAQNAFSGQQNHKILVILTDGEDLEARGIESAKAAASLGMKIYTVGVGSPAGELVPVKNEAGGVEFLKDSSGKTVRSKLDEATLRKLAEVTEGLYAPLGQRGEGLETIYEQGLASIPKQELSARMNRVYLERFQWPLAAVILLLVIEMLLGERRTGSRFKVQGSRLPVAKIQPPPLPTAARISVLLLLAAVPAAFASPRDAERAYTSGNYDQAAAQYKAAAEKSPKKTEYQFNYGAAVYKDQKYEDAAAAFERALKTDRVELQQKTFYNLGNTQYRIGQKTEKTEPKQTIQRWEQALQSYENAMQLKPDDVDAKYNYELVKKKLEQLKKQQPPPQQQQDQQDQQDQQKKQDQKDQKSQQDQQKPQDEQDQQNKSGGGGSDQQDKKNQKDEQKEQDKQNQKDQGGQGEQDQQQQGNPEPRSQKPEAGKQNPDEQKQKQGSKDEQAKGGKPDQKDQGKEKSPAGGDQKSGMRNQESAAEPQPLPGQMTKEEAKNLLDSLKGDERKMPASVIQGNPAQTWEDTTEKDW